MHVKVGLQPGWVKYFIQGHAASQQQIEEQNPDLLILSPSSCLIPVSCSSKLDFPQDHKPWGLMTVQQLTVAAEKLWAKLTSEKCKFKSTWPVIICTLTLAAHCSIIFGESSLVVSGDI